jgi:hypothetical protein
VSTVTRSIRIIHRLVFELRSESYHNFESLVLNPIVNVVHNKQSTSPFQSPSKLTTPLFAFDPDRPRSPPRATVLDSHRKQRPIVVQQQDLSSSCAWLTLPALLAFTLSYLFITHSSTCPTIVPLPFSVQMDTCCRSNTPWRLCVEDRRWSVSKEKTVSSWPSRNEPLPSEY